MKNLKKKITLIIICLILSLSIFPSIEASDSAIQKIEIGYTDEKGIPYYKEIEISYHELQHFRNSWDYWENYLKQIRKDGQMDDQELLSFEEKTVNLIEEIKELTKNSETGQYFFPDNLDIASFIHKQLFMLGFGAKIFSIGSGRVWLPFNRQGEAFIGSKFAPIFVRYSIGFTSVRVRSYIPFDLIVSNRFFSHRFSLAGFTGLYINFERQFIDNTAGPVILIGRPLLINLGDDII